MRTTHLCRTGVLAAAGVAAGALALAPGALAQGANTVELANGETRLHLDAGTAQFLAQNGVNVAPIGPATAQNGRVDFPVSGGDIVPNTGAGVINHTGGLRLTANGTTVNLRNFVVNTRSGTLSAQGLGPIINLDASNATVIRRGPGGIDTWIVRVDALVSAPGEAALEGAFGVDIPTGARLGRVDVLTSPAQVILRGGSTKLALSQTAVDALQGLGVQVGNVPPAAADTTGALNFPVTGQKVTLDGPAGTITHRGGISLSAGATNVRLTSFTINIDKRPDLTSLISGANRSSILNLDLSGSKVGVSKRQLVVTNVGTTLTGIAANALNGAFDVTAIPAGLDFGTARVQARIV